MRTKSAYYSRNNSYSRSLNAEIAESDNRYPLTRAAKHLGLSVASFKKGLLFANISTNEWHHVGKYANKVDYYDVSNDSEIVNSPLFWAGAQNKSNASITEQKRLQAIKLTAHNNLIEKFEIWSKIERKNKFSKDIHSKFHPVALRSLIYKIGDESCKYGSKSCQFVKVDSYTDSDGDNCLVGRHVKPFCLSNDNVKKLVRDLSNQKRIRFEMLLSNKSKLSYSFDFDRVKKILDRVLRGVVANNSLQYCTFNDWLAAAKVAKNLYGFEYTIDNNRVTIIK